MDMTEFLLFVGIVVLLVFALDFVVRPLKGSARTWQVPRKVSLVVVPVGAALLFLVVNSLFDLPKFWQSVSIGASAVVLSYALQGFYSRRSR